MYTKSRTVFKNRVEAGRELGKALQQLSLSPNSVVLALPRGGLPVALEVTRSLRVPLDILLVRKIGAPHQKELAIAALVEGKPEPTLVIDEETFRITGASTEYVERKAKEELREIARRRSLYLANRPSINVAGKDVILVDDGIATGTTVKASLKALQSQKPNRLILAVPVAPADTVEELRGQVDDLICLSQPYPFGAIGYFYEDFHQLNDDEVLSSLREADEIMTSSIPEEEVKLELPGVNLLGLMQVPSPARGVIIFVHGSGSSRLSSRNRMVADRLAKSGFATLLFDLLTTEEDSLRENRFDINLLKDRLILATHWLAERFDSKQTPFGYFGASTGAAAALSAAVSENLRVPIMAIVSRGGRPDLVPTSSLHRVTVPTLLIVGGRDEDVIEMNQKAAKSLKHCKHELQIVPNATHLFEEAGCLDRVAELAIDWFLQKINP